MKFGVRHVLHWRAGWQRSSGGFRYLRMDASSRVITGPPISIQVLRPVLKPFLNFPRRNQHNEEP